MTPLTARQIADASGGTLVAGDADAVAVSVSTSSKSAATGCVFVALRGDRFDGHRFLDEACVGGATVALVDRDVPTPAGVAVVRVADTRQALGRLANVVRRSVTRPKVIAIAGSNGKTSTKNALHAVLSRRLRGTASPKSFNNDIGVPATLFPVSAEDDYVILEVGTNHPGEVEHLSRMSEPDVAVITSIGEEHLEFFGSLDAVRQENAAIVAGLRSGGLLVMIDDAGLAERVDHDGLIIRFGDSGISDVRVTLDGTWFRTRDASAITADEPQGRSRAQTEWFIPTVGVHFATNALAVTAVARHLGLDDETIRTGLSEALASDMRMQKRVCGRVTLLNDAYNANPTSMRAALDTLARIEWPGRRVAVLGEMKELGEHASAAHAAVADAVRADAMFAVGPAWREPSERTGATWFPDATAAAGPVADAVRPGDLVLLKGSRSVALERVADAIAAKHV